MKNIAIFVSGNGESAQRLVKLFNEGNRLKTVLIITDDSAKDLTERIHDPEVEIVNVPDTEWHEKSPAIASLLQEKKVDLLVLDQFDMALSDEIMESTGGKLLRVTSSDLAPREVVAALEADLRKPVEEEKEPEEIKEENPSLESEWADTLKIQYVPPKVPQTPPEVPAGSELENEEKPERFENQKPWMANRYYENGRREPEFEENREPMPSTWLIWSILVTVFCCFIPGIIAIIFSSQVSSRYYSGDIEGARRSSRLAEIWIIVSFVLGVLTATLYLPLMLIGW